MTVHYLFTCVCAQSFCVCVCCPLCDPMECNPPCSSVHGIILARMLEWVAISSPRRSSLPRDWTHVSCSSCIGRWILYHLSLLGSHLWHFTIQWIFIECLQCVRHQARHCFLGYSKIQSVGHGNPLQYPHLENSHGQRSLAGYSTWGRKESDTIEWLRTAHKIQISSKVHRDI